MMSVVDTELKNHISTLTEKNKRYELLATVKTEQYKSFNLGLDVNEKIHNIKIIAIILAYVVQRRNIWPTTAPPYL